MTAPGNAMTQWPPGPDTGTDGGRRYAFALPARAESVAYARGRTRARLARWNLDAGTRETAALVISELATNAVVHAGGETILCELADHGLRLYVAVHDHGVGPNSPRANPLPGEADSGRGLLVVQCLSDAWGVHDTEPGPGRVVWAELPYGAGLLPG
ncbi:ATP-binding protein [Actinacidiphila soli]|uniref:ATP-binding protein n=1 Tax=Actinacidiphila soli TaxID=2487275 RepID=UPI002AFE9AE0|nr:ATP-binding protein [Actinacidiphila soli]